MNITFPLKDAPTWIFTNAHVFTKLFSQKSLFHIKWLQVTFTIVNCQIYAHWQNLPNFLKIDKISVPFSFKSI